ncbi:hypothetical protein [Ammoniphilus resinae]|uniref:Uncharacterized protein n=1 Tax=Ammoniphilus resinae TaxID=861532 RepID=A0ABS4GKY3_9BACL|nr:hypothetical protein [Ammoniphilus resinae]MBP1930916.1 hypothetical protein [Ammoniphilus resinae]
MPDYSNKSVEELEQLSAHYANENFEIMRELVRRGVGNNLPDTLEHPSMTPTEEDF